MTPHNTIGQWLNTLNEPHRTQALAYTDEFIRNNYAKDLKSALSGAFWWGESEEGDEYWRTLYREL